MKREQLPDTASLPKKDSSNRFPTLRHSREGGNPALFQRVITLQSGVPAFAGMTVGWVFSGQLHVLYIVALAMLTTLVQAHDLRHLPLGDNLKSDRPKKGHLWPCRIEPDGGGAIAVGPWINEADGTFDKTAKPQVPGDVRWPSRFAVTVAGGRRVFTGNGLPPHGSGIYPVPSDSEAYRYDPNPNNIAEQPLSFSLPLEPQLAEKPGCAPGAIGILLTGIPLFSAIDAPGRDAVAHEVQDKCDGHPQVTGVYHYHSISSCLRDERDADGSSKLMGYTVDGFGIYGPYAASGTELGNDDLDECHGITSEITVEGKRISQYHYVATAEFPYTVGCLRGSYDMETVKTLSGPPPGFSLWQLFR